MSSATPSLAEDGLKWTSYIHGDTYPAISSATASNLDGKVVMITGAAKGVGRATAISSARAGASHIVAADVAPFDDLEEAIDAAAKSNGKARPRTMLVGLDITDRAKVQDAAKSVAQTCGGLDLLINNAGRFEQYVPFLDSDPDSYWRAWEVNLGGTFNVARYFLPLLLGTKHGLKTMINVSSIGALTVRKGASSYRTTKLALLRWTEFLNADYGEQGLVAYCVHPGAILTELGSGMPKETHANLTDKPELAADTMVWLAQERREWLAGRYVSCCWDMPELVERKDEIVGGDKLKVRMAF
jgi:NAD(P)-dependent dehydrogenase (short-subunit alcohol dehydrogenase family)